MKKILIMCAFIATQFSLVACEPEKDGPGPNPGGGDYLVTKTDFNYFGIDLETSTTKWGLFFEEQAEAGEASEARSVILYLIANTSATFESGGAFGTFTPTTGGLSVGTFIESGYTTVAGGRLIPFTDGSVTVSRDGEKYTFDVNVTADDGTVIDFAITRTVGDSFSMMDATVISNMPEDHDQDVVVVRAEYNGDIMKKGTALWKMHIYGDDAVVDEDGIILGDIGTYLVLQFHSELDNISPEGRYTINSEFPANQGDLNTLDPGHDGLAGSWFQKVGGNNSITINAPMITGYIDIKKNTDGTFAIEYAFTDDNMEDPKNLTGDYSGEVIIIDRTDTGDFMTATFHFAENKYSDIVKSWEVTLESDEYFETEGVSGYVVKFVLNTEEDDTFYQKLFFGNYLYRAGSKESMFIPTGSVTTYANSVPTESPINGGKVFTEVAFGGDWLVELTDMTTVSGDTYTDLYFLGGFITTEKDGPGDLNCVLDENIATDIEYYGFRDGLTNWGLVMDNGDFRETLPNEEFDNYPYINILLDLYLVGNSSLADGIPNGTYPFVGKDNSEGGISTIVDPFFSSFQYGPTVYAFKSGNMTIEKITGTPNSYTITLDFISTIGSTLTGEFSGVVLVNDES